MSVTDIADAATDAELAAAARQAYVQARDALLSERDADGVWHGELSTSALSTATAVMALEMVRRASPGGADEQRLAGLISGGIRWLAEHQNADGGWGDTTKSISNISTTMLAHAVFHATGTTEQYAEVVDAAGAYIERAGGIPAVIARYGRDRTFSAPILTHCALAGLADWQDVIQLPFEAARLPARFYKTVRLPVVSYALPALIAVGQVRHHFRPTRIPGWRTLRNRSIEPTLKVLERIQPSNGGFLEAAPLTSFVTMSLAAKGLSDHVVAQRGVKFLIESAREDGSWPIDTNLATWVTTLSVNALGDDLPETDREPILQWLLDQQYKSVHPYTNADPGGWAWTDLPGGVPDADDTPGAMLAIDVLGDRGSGTGDRDERIRLARENGVRWLLGLQNRDGGFPTFCRGWGKLPFDRSAPDITAHCLRALIAGQSADSPIEAEASDYDLANGATLDDALAPLEAVRRGFRFLEQSQRPDGSWLPLWFGNQHAPDDINPTYGTARVLAAYRDANAWDREPAQRGVGWLVDNQNDDGGWGGLRDTPSSVEETALATEILFSRASSRSVEDSPARAAAFRGVRWLIAAVEDGSFRDPSPIGFYFAKLWYFERLYPQIFTVAALRRAVRMVDSGEPIRVQKS